jgi:hypothetical protein
MRKSASGACLRRLAVKGNRKIANGRRRPPARYGAL